MWIVDAVLFVILLVLLILLYNIGYWVVPGHRTPKILKLIKSDPPELPTSGCIIVKSSRLRELPREVQSRIQALIHQLRLLSEVAPPMTKLRPESGVKYLLSFSGGVLVGILKLHDLSKDPRLAALSLSIKTQKCDYYVSTVMVDPMYQGQGIGSGMFEFLLQHYDCCMVLHAKKDNIAARKLYSKFGFVEIPEDPTLMARNCLISA